MLIDMCRGKKADGVISCMMKFCDPEEYDQPYFERDLRKAGYPCLAIEIDPLNTNYEQLLTKYRRLRNCSEPERVSSMKQKEGITGNRMPSFLQF